MKYEYGTVDPKAIKISQKSCENLFYNLRQTFNAETMKELRNDIATDGQEQAILVRQLPDGKYELIAGERRLRSILKLIEDDTVCYNPKTGEEEAASKVFKEIDAKILFDCDDLTALKKSVSENLSREDVNPIDLMNFCIDLTERRDDLGKKILSSQQVANILGKKTAWVSLTKQLNKLPANVKQMLADGEIDRSTALYLLKVNPNKMQSVIGEARKIAQASKELEKNHTETLYQSAVKDAEMSEGKLAVLSALGKSTSDAKKARTLAQQKLKESKTRREAANEKKAKVTTDLLQEVAKKKNALNKKAIAISPKIIKTKKTALKEELEKGDVRHPDSGRKFDKKYVELFLAVCDGVLGKDGIFEPLNILDSMYEKWENQNSK